MSIGLDGVDYFLERICASAEKNPLPAEQADPTPPKESGPKNDVSPPRKRKRMSESWLA